MSIILNEKIVIIFVIIILSLTGCSSENETVVDNANNAENNTEEYGITPNRIAVLGVN